MQFPPRIEVFYVVPPALDEIKRWLRDHEAKQSEEAKKGAGKEEGEKQ